MRLAFHRAERQAFDEISLGIERESKRRRGRQDDRRGDLAVLDAGGGDEGERADRHRLLVGGGEDEREDEVVPAENEGEQPRGGDAGPRQRYGDAR